MFAKHKNKRFANKQQDLRSSSLSLNDIDTAQAQQALTEIHQLFQSIDLSIHLVYPLQRVDDLVVGVAMWASRATIYRHVQALEAHELVESVLQAPGDGEAGLPCR